MDDLVMIVGRFRSSDGTTEYVVRKSEFGRLTCTCPGFKYRRGCKHCERCKDVPVNDQEAVYAIKDGEYGEGGDLEAGGMVRG